MFEYLFLRVPPYLAPRPLSDLDLGMRGGLLDLLAYLLSSGYRPLCCGEYLLRGEGARLALLPCAKVGAVIGVQGYPSVHYRLLLLGRVQHQGVVDVGYGHGDWDLVHGQRDPLPRVL